MKNTITIRLSKELSKELQYVVEQEGKPISEVVSKSLVKYAVSHRFRNARAGILPYARKAGIITDEDAFRFFSRRGD